jgi:hypothetical protein
MADCGIVVKGGTRCHSRHFLAFFAFRNIYCFWLALNSTNVDKIPGGYLMAEPISQK